MIWVEHWILETSMTSKDRITARLVEKRDFLHAEFGVQRIGLFGSHGKGIASAGSDIDLVVEFAGPIGFRFFALAEYLEELLGAPVDILTPAGIEGIRVPRVAREIRESLVYV
jgi:predicted nucleotidyltransferase